MKVKSKYLFTTNLVHRLVALFLGPGEKAIDATMGKGKDTLFLAQTVGPNGVVYAFDIQKAALESTRQLLKENNCYSQVCLIQAGHETIRETISEPVQAIVYNLGYLPGGDKKIITRAETTLLSLKQSMELLNRGGIISLTVYPGHPGGAEEAALLNSYLSTLSTKSWQVMKWSKVNDPFQRAPYVIFLSKF